MGRFLLDLQYTLSSFVGIKRLHKPIDVIDQKLYEKFYSVKWMNSNKLTMNLEKTQCLLISTKQKLWEC